MMQELICLPLGVPVKQFQHDLEGLLNCEGKVIVFVIVDGYPFVEEFSDAVSACSLQELCKVFFPFL